MSKTTNIIASTVAAAAIATGVYVATNNESTESPSEFVIDWSQYLPDMAQYIPEVPSIELPTTTIDLEIGNLCDNEISNSVNQDVDNLISSSMVEVSIDANFIEYNLFGNEFNVGEIFTEELSISDPTSDLASLMEKQKLLQNYLKDQRSLNHDKNILINKYIDKWIEIYKTYSDRSFSVVSKVNKFRMITEVRLPKSNKEFIILEKNLTYYKSRGYDSALVVFDGSESPSDLKYLARYVKSKGFRTFFAFGGRERLEVSIFVDPNLLKDQLSMLSEECEGFLIGWRRTSAHLLEQDEEFMNFMISAVRSGNSNCAIFGELYYGNTHKYPERNEWGFGMNIPKCSSAIMICNFGFSSVNIDAVIKKIAPKMLGKSSLIGVVVGQKPYYLTVNKNGLSQQKNQEIKEYIEKKFMNAGCVGTITLHDDGRDYSERFCNNLSSTLYLDLK